MLLRVLDKASLTQDLGVMPLHAMRILIEIEKLKTNELLELF